MARGQNVTGTVFNKPLLITLDALQPISDYLSSPDRVSALRVEKPQEEPELKLSNFDSQESYEKAKLNRLGINPETMVGTLDISGTLVYRSGSMNANCTELVSYESLKQQAEAQIEAGVKTLVLKVDSGGGQAHGLFSAANHIKKIAKQSGVKTVAYVDGLSASAAYGLAVLADEIVAHPQSQVGSVGVVVQLYNDSKMLENVGIKRQFVFAGDNKIPFDNSTGEFTDKFVNDLQKSIDKTYKTFVQHVATNRGLTDQDVIDTQASVYDVDEALSLGLIDKVMELEDFELEYGLKVSNNSTTGFSQHLSSPVENILTQEGIMSELNADQLQVQLSTALKDKETLASQLATASEQLQSAQAELQELSTLKEAMAAELNDLAKAKELLEQEKAQAALDAKIASRTAKLEDALGKDNEKVASLLSSTETLSDEQFDIIATSLASAQDAKQEQFNEKGGEGDDSQTQLSLSDKLKAKAQAMQTKKTV